MSQKVNGPVRPDAIDLFLKALGFLISCVFCVHAVRFALYKNFSLDEFTYLHTAWLIFKGFVPTRDFSFGFPLAPQFFSLPFLFLGDDPSMLIVIRMWSAVFCLSALWIAVWRVNDGVGRTASVLTVALLSFVLPFLERVTEIRPDPLAFALFMLAVAVHSLKHRSAALRGFLSGVFLALAVWASVKAVVYGSIFALAWSVDVTWNRSRRTPLILSNSLFFLLGALLVGALTLAYVASTQSLTSWYDGCIRGMFRHEGLYPTVSGTTSLMSFLANRPILVPLALAGIFDTARKRMDAPASFLSSADFFLSEARRRPSLLICCRPLRTLTA